MKIIKCEPIMNGKAHGVTLEDGRQCTAWNDKVDSGILMQLYASGSECNLELKPYTSAAGKSGLNVVSIIGDPVAPGTWENNIKNNITGVKVTNPSGTMGNIAVPLKKHPLRDDSILAQVYLKCAVRMLCAETGTILKRDEYLADCIRDFNDAWKFGVKLSENN